MNQPEDPEGRVADLERQLSEVAATGEAPPIGEPRRTGLRLGWLALAVMVAVLVISAVALAGRLGGGRPVAGTPTTSEYNGGGGTFATTPTATSSSAGPFTPTQRQSPARSAEPTDPELPTQTGGSISVAGVGKNETIACEDGIVSVSGVDNEVMLTGHCERVVVSGVRNTVMIDESSAIVVSGMDNVVTYRTGNPDLSQSGMGNTLSRG